jgi:hypothetical protein
MTRLEQMTPVLQLPVAHCAHRTGVALMTAPVQYEVICCRCGTIGRETPRRVAPEGHGPFAPREVHYRPEDTVWRNQSPHCPEAS